MILMILITKISVFLLHDKASKTKVFIFQFLTVIKCESLPGSVVYQSRVIRGYA